ncbi:MAG: hypothetical protein M1831_003404 [Alyxoria varia]|nr:MAG: hypothetical protein M1831_003404 [Alyxoria varia]
MAGMPPGQPLKNNPTNEKPKISPGRAPARLPHGLGIKQTLKRDGFSRSSSLSYQSADLRSSTSGQPKCYSCGNPERSKWHALIKCRCGRRFHGGCHKPSIPPEPQRIGWICNVCTRKGRKPVIDLTNDEHSSRHAKPNQNGTTPAKAHQAEPIASAHAKEQQTSPGRVEQKNAAGSFHDGSERASIPQQNTFPIHDQAERVEISARNRQFDDHVSDSAYYSNNGSRRDSEILTETVEGESLSFSRVKQHDKSAQRNDSQHRTLNDRPTSKLTNAQKPSGIQSGTSGEGGCSHHVRRNSSVFHRTGAKPSHTAVNAPMTPQPKAVSKSKTNEKPKESFEDMVESQLTKEPGRPLTKMRVFDGIQRQFRWYKEQSNMQPGVLMWNIEEALASPRFERLPRQKGPGPEYWRIKRLNIAPQQTSIRMTSHEKSRKLPEESKPLSYCRFYDFTGSSNDTKYRIVARHQGSKPWNLLTLLEGWDACSREATRYRKGDFVELKLNTGRQAYAQIIQIRRVNPATASFELHWIVPKHHFEQVSTYVSNPQDWPSIYTHLLSTWRGLVNQESIGSKISQSQLEQIVAPKKMLSFSQGCWTVKPITWKIFSWGDNHDDAFSENRLGSKRPRDPGGMQLPGTNHESVSRNDEPAFKKARIHEPPNGAVKPSFAEAPRSIQTAASPSPSSANVTSMDLSRGTRIDESAFKKASTPQHVHEAGKSAAAEAPRAIQTSTSPLPPSAYVSSTELSRSTKDTVNRMSPTCSRDMYDSIVRSMNGVFSNENAPQSDESAQALADGERPQAPSNDMYSNVVRSMHGAFNIEKASDFNKPAQALTREQQHDKEANKDNVNDSNPSDSAIYDVTDVPHPAKHIDSEADPTQTGRAKLPQDGPEESARPNRELAPSIVCVGIEPSKARVQVEETPERDVATYTGDPTATTTRKNGEAEAREDEAQVDDPPSNADFDSAQNAHGDGEAAVHVEQVAGSPHKGSKEPPHIARIREMYKIPPLNRFRVCIYNDRLAYRDIETDEIWVVPRSPTYARKKEEITIGPCPSSKHAAFKAANIESNDKSRTKYVRAVWSMMRRRLLRDSSDVDLGELVAAAIARKKEGER